MKVTLVFLISLLGLGAQAEDLYSCDIISNTYFSKANSVNTTYSTDFHLKLKVTNSGSASYEWYSNDEVKKSGPVEKVINGSNMVSFVIKQGGGETRLEGNFELPKLMPNNTGKIYYDGHRAHGVFGLVNCQKDVTPPLEI